MYSLAISFIVAILISGSCIASGVKSGSTAYGILGFILTQVLISLLIRKKIKAANGELQQLLAAGQKKMGIKMSQFQMKPGADPTLMQRQLERDQQELFKSALAFTGKLEPFKKWNPIMGKQIATMRLQFLYQLKEFDQVDALLAKGWLTSPILAEPMLVAMKMARQYQRKETEAAEKTFKRHLLWFRSDSGALLYGVMSWIYVQQNRVNDALLLLAKAKEKMYNEVITRNWEMLSNNREKSFSNAGFGDQWYGLYLEKPPMPKRQQIRMPQGKGRRPF